MIHRASKASALAVAAALVTMAAGASAQEFSFETNKILGSPNEVVEVPVYVKGAAVPVGGLNFTVRIPASALADIQLDQATTSTDLAGFTYAFNANVSRTGVSTGVIQGDVHEFRGVIYGTGDPAPSFNANLPVKVASIFVPISSTAHGTYPVELAVDQDGITAVGGISDVVGNSIPGGGVRPGGDDIVFDITDNFAPIVTDFTTPQGRTNWIYTGQIPADVPNQPVGSVSSVEGLGITTVVDNSYGYWGYDPNVGSIRNPASDLLHVVKWDMRASADGGDAPTPRLRHATANFFMSQEINLIDLGNLLGDDGFFSPPGTAGKTYSTVVQVPGFAADGVGLDGLNYFFDLLQFGVFAPPLNIGKVGETAWLRQAREYFVETSALSNPQVLYSQTYSNSNPRGFTQGAPAQLGRPVTYLVDANGIGVTSSGGFDANGNLSLGSWSNEPLGFNFDSSKFYKIDITVSAFDFTDNSFDPFWVPNVRVRLHNFTNEVSNNFNLTSTSFFDAAVPYLSTTPQTYTVWMNPFPEMNGVEAFASFEAIHVLSNFNGLDDNMTLYLNGLTVTAYDAPVLP